MFETDIYDESDEVITVGFLNCVLGENDHHTLMCNGTRYVLPEIPLTYQDSQFWLYIFLYIFLMLSSGKSAHKSLSYFMSLFLGYIFFLSFFALGVFSGLVIGLVSLDLTILKVLKDAGTPSVKKYATKISPLVERHHLLLVTLLLANAIAMEALPLCLDRISDPLTAIFASVTTVLFFGE